jgi:hypothetical protein
MSIRESFPLRFSGFVFFLGRRKLDPLRQKEHFFLWFCSSIQALAASMKLSVSLQLIDLGQSVGFFGRMMSSLQSLYLYKSTKNAHTTQTLNIHALSVIRTHGPDVRASEDS